jgi:hypothetical protein
MCRYSGSARHEVSPQTASKPEKFNRFKLSQLKASTPASDGGRFRLERTPKSAD